MNKQDIEIRKTFSGKQVLLVGASGFLGKVWLSLVLHELPEVEKIYVLLRRKGTRTANERFEEMINSSYVFQPLHEKYGESLSAYLCQKVEVIEGDVCLPNLGLREQEYSHLTKNLDLLVNFAGLVDFNPDLRDALAINVDGTLNTAEFVRHCERAKLIHVSTCYVSGRREGRLPEAVDPHRSPNGKLFRPEREIQEAQEAIESICSEQAKPEFQEKIREKMEARSDRNGKSERLSESRAKALMKVWRRKFLRDALIEEGKRRAAYWGWTNTYTYTKALAEMILSRQYEDVSFCIFRPSIVESSVSYPFPGWNEGFNTSGPLAYLLRTWFRFLPATKGNPFDVVPVDQVCNGLLVSAAALMEGVGAKVVHCGTSDLNRFTIDRACELTALGHRTHFRKNGNRFTDRSILSRWDAISTPKDYRFSVWKIQGVTSTLTKVLSTSGALGSIPRMKTLANRLEKMDRKLGQVVELMDLFLPFIHDHFQVFEASFFRTINAAEKEFRFDPQSFGWREYWLNIHMPGLRRWCFPSIEGREVEKFVPVFPFEMQSVKIPEPRFAKRDPSEDVTFRDKEKRLIAHSERQAG